MRLHGALHISATRICTSDKAPILKIRAWFLKRYQLKRERVLTDPELYRASTPHPSARSPLSSRICPKQTGNWSAC